MRSHRTLQILLLLLIINGSFSFTATAYELYTQEQLNKAVMAERLKYDPDGDGRIELSNVIYFLQILSGQRIPVQEDIPAWLQEKIRDFASSPPANPPVIIYKTYYASGVAYFIPSRCCDFFSELYREDGTLICYPSGGYTGMGDNRCPDFTLSFGSEVVWQDIRERF